MKHITLSPEMKRMIAAQKAGGVVADRAQLVKLGVPTPDGGKITELETANETILAKTDSNGKIEKVAVKEKNPLIPLAIIAATLFLLGG